MNIASIQRYLNLLKTVFLKWQSVFAIGTLKFDVPNAKLLFYGGPCQVDVKMKNSTVSLSRGICGVLNSSPAETYKKPSWRLPKTTSVSDDAIMR